MPAPPRRVPRRGFSLTELLVCVAIVTVAAALALPAVLAARTKARDAQCISRQRQIAHAVISYQQDQGGLPPPGEPGEIGGWSVELLPYLGDGVLGESAWDARGTPLPASPAVLRRRPPVLTCPARDDPPPPPGEERVDPAHYLLIPRRLPYEVGIYGLSTVTDVPVDSSVRWPEGGGRPAFGAGWAGRGPHGGRYQISSAARGAGTVRDGDELDDRLNGRG